MAPTEPNNMATIRSHAEQVAQILTAEQGTPLETGYLVVILCLHEAAGRLRAAADAGLTNDQLREMAQRLDDIGNDAVLLAEAETKGKAG